MVHGLVNFYIVQKSISKNFLLNSEELKSEAKYNFLILTPSPEMEGGILFILCHLS